MKRGIGETELFKSIAVTNCLISLSHSPYVDPVAGDSCHGRVFECKTCNRQFPSFQALGGHRASHKKLKLNPPEDHGPVSSLKLKTHECSVCGLEFAVGQALGGHMRRHRMTANAHHQGDTALTTFLSLHPPPSSTATETIPVEKKSNSRSVPCLDLNLTPLENDLGFRLGKSASPVVDCFI